MAFALLYHFQRKMSRVAYRDSYKPICSVSLSYISTPQSVGGLRKNMYIII